MFIVRAAVVSPHLKEFTVTHLDDFTLTLGSLESIPIIVGGMGVDVSTPALALSIANLNGIAHLSDAMLPSLVDRHYGTHFARDKVDCHRSSVGRADKSAISFDLDALATATRRYISTTMNAKRGGGSIFLNVMEKLTMANPHATLQVRLAAAMDAGIDGITLSAGLHLGSPELIRAHPRCHDIKLGIIVSSARALRLFLHRAVRVGRLPDYIIVEGPLAGGHLGFPHNWHDFDLKVIVGEVLRLLAADDLHIPVIAAGGIFTGTDAVEFLRQGASGVQVATRFTVTQESGLPDVAKQAFFSAQPEDVVVNSISPTGYPMRMLKSSPAIGAGIQPMCETYGYALDRAGTCSYNTEYFQEQAAGTDKHPMSKTCLCSMMLGYKALTCGHTVSRLKDTTHKLADGSYQVLTAEQVFRDYQRSTDQRILLPPLAEPA